MKLVYFDCFSGAGGDMIAGALIDAGASLDGLRAQLAHLDVPGFQVRAEKVRKQGFAATKFHVETDAAHDHPHRRLADIQGILTNAKLADSVRRRSLAVFERLARAEAEAHGVSPQEIHFHEVGAVDAIVDIVTAMLALDELAPERILCSPLPVGSGTVTCQHGVMPVPAPATAILLKGVPLAESDERAELLTPTAAAILTTLAEDFVPLPAMTIERIGTGAGTRDNQSTPNVLRVLVGSLPPSPADEADTVAVLEANIDDAPAEWLGHCVERLLRQGALDAYCLPIQMKKSRPGVVLTAICERQRVEEFETIIFEETPTFGIRRQLVRRAKLSRSHEAVETRFGTLRMKVGRRRGQVVTAAPEYEDCVSAAAEKNTPLRVVMDAAVKAWHESRSG